MAYPAHLSEPVAQTSEELELAGLAARVDAALRVELAQQEPPEGDEHGLEVEVLGM